MKLYELAPSPSARRVSLFLAEKSIDIPRVAVNTLAGENITPEFIAMSVNGKIPVLELEDGTAISESIAICRYLDAQFPTDHHLFGRTPLEIGKVEMWNRIAEFQGLFAAFQAFRNITGLFSDRERCVEAWGHESKLRVEEFLPVLEHRLAESPYLAGDHFSVADITAYITCGFLPRIDIDIEGRFPAIHAWMEKLDQREAFIACHQASA